MIKQSILAVYVQGKHSIQKAGDVVFIVFTNRLHPVLFDKQTHVS